MSLQWLVFYKKNKGAQGQALSERGTMMQWFWTKQRLVEFKSHVQLLVFL